VIEESKGSFACAMVTPWLLRFGVRHEVFTGRGVVRRRGEGCMRELLRIRWVGVLGGCSGVGNRCGKLRLARVGGGRVA